MGLDTKNGVNRKTESTAKPTAKSTEPKAKSQQQPSKKGNNNIDNKVAGKKNPKSFIRFAFKFIWQLQFCTCRSVNIIFVGPEIGLPGAENRCYSYIFSFSVTATIVYVRVYIFNLCESLIYETVLWMCGINQNTWSSSNGTRTGEPVGPSNKRIYGQPNQFSGERDSRFGPTARRPILIKQCHLWLTCKMVRIFHRNLAIECNHITPLM